MSIVEMHSLLLAIGAIALACVSIAWAVVGRHDTALGMGLIAIVALIASEVILK